MLETIPCISSASSPVGRSPAVSHVIAAQSARLAEAGVATPALDARLIVLHVCGLSLEELVLAPDRPISQAEAEAIEANVSRRLLREPVSRILGKRHFRAHEFLISPAVLDPRPDTETVIDTALSILEEQGQRECPLRIIDLGTGSGCILLSLLAELPNASGIGTDIDPVALEIARVNARRLTLEPRSAFICTDWSAAICEEYDLIIANPPYIRRGDIRGLDPEVWQSDPMIALDGGVDGLDAYRSIARSAIAIAKVGCWIVLEAGIGQATEIVNIFSETGWHRSEDEVRLYPDLAGVNRVVAIKRHTDPTWRFS